MMACEKCAALERENEALRKDNAKLEAMLHDDRLRRLRIIANSTSETILASLKYKGSASSAARFLESHTAANDRWFSQHKALFELPLKTEQMKGKIENTRARTTNIEVDTQLKQEKVRALQADRELKERQAMLIEAATMVLERYAQTGNMVDADFEVIDQLKEIGFKIPARITQKTLKQTNSAR